MSEATDELAVVEELPDRQLPESVDDVTLYAEYRRVTADQAALRRLAMLVARGAEPAEVFEAVVNEMRRCASADTAGLWRYEPNDEMTKLAAAEHPGLHLAKWPVGTRSPVDGSTLAGIVRRTGRPARLDSYENSTGSLAARIRDAGVHAAVGVPVVVDGRVWGLAAVGSVEPKPMPADTEARISAFAELIGTVVVAGHHDEQKRQLLTEASQLSIGSMVWLRDAVSATGVCGTSRASFGYRPTVRLWSSPHRFRSRAKSRFPTSNPSFAASTYRRRGVSCLICRSGLRASRPTKNSTRQLP